MNQRAESDGTVAEVAHVPHADRLFGLRHVAPALASFLAEFPDVAARLSFEDRKVELLAEGFDVAIRIGDLPDSTLKGRGLMMGVDVGAGELAADICARAFRRGLIIETSGNEDQVVKVLAPITTPKDTLHKGFDILMDAARDALAAPGSTGIAAE